MADLCHAEIGRVGIPVGSQAVLQGNLLALQGVHQIPELRGRSHTPSTAGAAHNWMAIVATKLQVVWRWEKQNGQQGKLSHNYKEEIVSRGRTTSAKRYNWDNSYRPRDGLTFSSKFVENWKNIASNTKRKGEAIMVAEKRNREGERGKSCMYLKFQLVTDEVLGRTNPAQTIQNWQWITQNRL